MAKKSRRNPAASSLNRALQNHGGDDTNYQGPMTSLPPGINRGIARLVEAKIGVYKTGSDEGEQFIRLAGVVVEPESVAFARRAFQDGKVVTLSSETMEVQGLQTSMMLPLCRTKNRSGDVTDLDEHVERAENELRKLGADTIVLADSDDPERDLKILLEDLKDAEPHFKFSTSEGTPNEQYPTPRVWENWHGDRGLEDYSPEDGNGGEVVDDTPTTEEEPTEEPTEEPSLSDLGQAVDDEAEGAEQAEKELRAMAAAKELDPDDYDTWVALAIALKELGTDAATPSEDEGGKEDDWQPKAEEVWGYKPPKKRNPVDCEVMSVNVRTKTVTLHNLDDDTEYKGVKWDKLIGED